MPSPSIKAEFELEGRWLCFVKDIASQQFARKIALHEKMTREQDELYLLDLLLANKWILLFTEEAFFSCWERFMIFKILC